MSFWVTSSTSAWDRGRLTNSDKNHIYYLAITQAGVPAMQS
jgi:hypothetical protein